jgi:ribonuclease T1
MSRGRGLWQALAVALAFALAAFSTGAGARDSGHAGAASIKVVAAAELPPEARQTLKLIREGGPFAYARDGLVFGNFERLLPRREKGYYREYTVPTPGLKHRGARRIVAGDGGERYYTDDHYRSFRRIRE